MEYSKWFAVLDPFYIPDLNRLILSYVAKAVFDSNGHFEGMQVPLHPKAYWLVKEGPWTTYHTKGQIKSKVTYVAGKKEGPYYEYYPTGQVKYMGQYANDLKVGWWVGYTLQGAVKINGYYFEGEKVGIWCMFRHGLCQDQHFINGKNVSRYDYLGRRNHLAREQKLGDWWYLPHELGNAT